MHNARDDEQESRKASKKKKKKKATEMEKSKFGTITRLGIFSIHSPTPFPPPLKSSTRTRWATNFKALAIAT
jgi:hypothetical protein